MIRWLFLDVGGVILDEDVLSYHVFRHHANAIRDVRPDLSLLDLIDERETRVRSGSQWPVFDCASSYLPPGRVASLWEEVEAEVRSRFEDFLPPLEDSLSAIAELSKQYRLGIIANQPAEIRGVLAGLGMLDYFDVVLLSEEVGWSKPDPRIFQNALHSAGVPACNAVMVGDRIRQDMAPASQVGMRTILVNRPEIRPPNVDAGQADFHAYRTSLRRLEAEERIAHRELGHFFVESLNQVSVILGRNDERQSEKALD